MIARCEKDAERKMPTVIRTKLSIFSVRWKMYSTREVQLLDLYGLLGMNNNWKVMTKPIMIIKVALVNIPRQVTVSFFSSLRLASRATWTCVGTSVVQDEDSSLSLWRLRLLLLWHPFYYEVLKTCRDWPGDPPQKYPRIVEDIVP